MGKFIINNNNQEAIIKSIASGVKDILNNPYYLFSDKKASISTYYNINTTMTTLDSAVKDNYSEISIQSPIRFNKVIGFYLYGITQITPNLDIGEYGLETSDITGEALVLPYTIIPYPGDFFTLDQIDKPYLFRVTAVNPNTLDTGATMYKINYTLASTDGDENIEPQVVKTYKFSASNMGTNFSCLIEEEDYNNANDIEEITTMLKDYYMSLFYDAKIQSFSYNKNDVADFASGGIRTMCKHCFGFKVYDPYLIEFLIRNKILSGATNYIHIQQQMYLPNTFGVDYDRTIFSSIENKDLSRHIGRYAGNLLLNEQKLSLLYAYAQDYYYMEYARINPKFYIIDIFNDPEFAKKIESNTLTSNVLKNVIIGYFNNTKITKEILNEIRHIDYMDSMELFYLIPLAIYCLEQQIINILS